MKALLSSESKCCGSLLIGTFLETKLFNLPASLKFQEDLIDEIVLRKHFFFSHFSCSQRLCNAYALTNNFLWAKILWTWRVHLGIERFSSFLMCTWRNCKLWLHTRLETESDQMKIDWKRWSYFLCKQSRVRGTQKLRRRCCVSSLFLHTNEIRRLESQLTTA